MRKHATYQNVKKLRELDDAKSEGHGHSWFLNIITKFGEHFGISTFHRKLGGYIFKIDEQKNPNHQNDYQLIAFTYENARLMVDELIEENAKLKKMLNKD